MSNTGSVHGDGHEMMNEPNNEQIHGPNYPEFYENPEQVFHQRRREAAARRHLEFEQEARGHEGLPPPQQIPQQHRRNPQQQPRGYAPQQQRGGRPFRLEPTMGELSAPYVDDQPWCIHPEPDEDDFEVRTGIIHLLPKFAGLPGEIAIRHLKEFEGICSTLKPYSANMDRFKLKVFPFSLTDIAKTWFMSVPSDTIYSWTEMKKAFLDKFYPPGKAIQVRRELSTIRQGNNESMYDYLERFNTLEQSCCNLGITEKMLVEYLLEGMRGLERMMLDAAAGGTVMNLSPREVRNLIKETAESARFREDPRRDDVGRTRNVSQVNSGNSEMANELNELKEMMHRMMVAQVHGAQACDVCGSASHRSSECPTLIYDESAEVNVMGGYQNYNNNRQGPPKFGLAANGYSWREGGFSNNQVQNQQNQQPYRPPIPPNERYNNQSNQYQQRRNYNQSGQNNASSSKSLEDHFKEFQIETRNSIAELTKHMSRLAEDVAELKAEKGKLPSQTIPNPKGSVNAVTLRNGRELQEWSKTKKNGFQTDRPAPEEQLNTASEEQIEETSYTSGAAINPSSGADSSVPSVFKPASDHQTLLNSSSKVPIDISERYNSINVPLPFPMQKNSTKKRVMDKELMELFSRVEITIPLLDAIKQIPKYAKFLKELCTNRRGGLAPEQVNLKNISAILQCKIAPKCEDRGTFTISCIIGSVRIDNCMLDLGAAINVIPYSVFRTLKIGPLQPTNLTIQLANRSCTKPEGMLIDVVVRVGKLVFLADFYVMKTEEEDVTDAYPS